jgi:hypothetical protein
MKKIIFALIICLKFYPQLSWSQCPQNPPQVQMGIVLMQLQQVMRQRQMMQQLYQQQQLIQWQLQLTQDAIRGQQLMQKEQQPQ